MYLPKLKRIIVLVYTREVISTKSEGKPFKSTISIDGSNHAKV